MQSDYLFSTDEYLQGWRCCLVRPARVDGESIALHEVRKRKRDEGQARGDPLVQVVFVDNNDSVSESLLLGLSAFLLSLMSFFL
jgi:hypothetical protein